MTNGSQHSAPNGGALRMPGTPASPLGDAVSAQVATAIVQAVIGMLAPAKTAGGQPADKPSAMLTVAQAATLLGISRMTVTRRADAGELPCVVVSRGTRQKMRRFPRAMIEHLATSGGGSGGAEADLKDCAAHWLATVADAAGAAEYHG